LKKMLAGAMRPLGHRASLLRYYAQRMPRRTRATYVLLK
jgi:hypothetical protein